jgi:hypothetical protein
MGAIASSITSGHGDSARIGIDLVAVLAGADIPTNFYFKDV